MPTLFFANAWAGSFAMTREVATTSGLIARWRTAMVDDGPVRPALESIGKRIVVAPSLLMINREPCTPGFALRWTTRMLTWSRYYESTFWLTCLYALIGNVVMLGTMGFLVISMSKLVAGSGGGWSWIAIAASLSLVLSAGLCLAAYRSTRRCVAASCELRGQRLESMSFLKAWQVLIASAPALSDVWNRMCQKPFSPYN